MSDIHMESADLLAHRADQSAGRLAMQALRVEGTCLSLTGGELTIDGSPTIITVNLHPFPLGDLALRANMEEHVQALSSAGDDRLELRMSEDWRWGFDADRPDFRMSRRDQGRIIRGERTLALARLVLVDFSATDAFHFITLDR